MAAKIKVDNPVVDIDGDEMTRYVGVWRRCWWGVVSLQGTS